MRITRRHALGALFIAFILLCLSNASYAQVHHTFPALDTNNDFTGTNSFSSPVVLYLHAAPTSVAPGTIAIYADPATKKLCSEDETLTIVCISGGTGTVTNFSAGNLSPLFTTMVTNGATTPSLTFALSTAAAHTVYGNNTGSTATPSFFSFIAPATIACNGTDRVSAFDASTGLYVCSPTGGGGGTPGAPDGSFQYNCAGSFCGAAALFYDVANNTIQAGADFATSFDVEYELDLGGEGRPGTSGQVAVSQGAGNSPQWFALADRVLTGCSNAALNYNNAGTGKFNCAEGTLAEEDANGNFRETVAGVIAKPQAVGTFSTITPLISSVPGTSTLTQDIFQGDINTTVAFRITNLGLALGRASHGGAGEESGFGLQFVANGTIAAGNPVKIDTSTNNRVIATVTTDTADKAVVGVATRAATVNNTVYVVIMGYNSDLIADNTCNVGDFVIVSTGTNGKVSCTVTYSAKVLGRSLTSNGGAGEITALITP